MGDVWIMLAVGLGVLVLVVLIIGFGSEFSQQAKARRRMAKVPIVSIADARDGARVRVVGTVTTDAEVVRAPLSGREAVYWDVAATRYETDLRKGPESTHGGGNFWVKDETGTALVRTAGAYPALVRDHIVSYEAADAPVLLFEIFEAAGYRYPRGTGGWMAEEGVVQPGETVAVVGVASSEGVGDARRVTISADPELGLVLSDDWRAHRPAPKGADAAKV